MRVSLRPPTKPAPGPIDFKGAAAPLLDPAGPFCVLGSVAAEGELTAPVRASQRTLFGPRGAALAGPEGPLYVTDTGHHRLLVWRKRPDSDRAPADFVIGQPDFFREGRNAKGETGAATLNVPTGVAAAGGVLAVADAWNHRVLIWRAPPASQGQPADVVLGQADFAGTQANRGGEPGPHTLNWCYGVCIADGRLIVCDTGNRRVLIWNAIPDASGAPADLVLGQSRMDCRDENGGRAVDAAGMRWPHGAAVVEGRLIVADAGDNRLMAWSAMPRANGAPCDFVVGQCDPDRADHNRAAYWPDAASLNMPYGCCATEFGLAVADTANSRLLGFSDLYMGAPADRLTGQGDFAAKGDNRWKLPARDSLCWPYGLSIAGDVAAIADSGNNRVLLWRLAS